MYKSLNKKEEITLCESNSLKRKTQDDIPASKRQAREDEIDATYHSLKEKHSETYESPKLRLWARMIPNGLHDSVNEPPNIPAFCGGGPKKKTTAEAIGGVMDALLKIVEQKTPESGKMYQLHQQIHLTLEYHFLVYLQEKQQI